MSRRFYFQFTGFCDWTKTPPDTAAAWNNFADNIGRVLLTEKEDPGSSDNMEKNTISVNPGGGDTLPCKFGVVSYVGPALAAQTISGTVKGQMYADQPYPGGIGFCRSVVIRVLRPSTEDPVTHIYSAVTEVGILLEFFPSVLVSEFNYYQNEEDGSIHTQNRNFPPVQTLTPVVCQDGDYIVVELGVTRFAVGDATDSDSKSASLYTYNENKIGSGLTGDLPVDETTIAAQVDFGSYTVPQLDPWIEFSNLRLSTDPLPVDISGSAGLLFGASLYQGFNPLTDTPATVSGTAGLLLGSSGKPKAGSVGAGVIFGTAGLKLGGNGNLVAGPAIVGRDISGRAGLSFGSSGSPTVPPKMAGINIPGAAGLVLGSRGNLVANPIVPVDVSGRAGLLLGSSLLTEVGEDYETWLLNDNSFAPSAYSNWPFNSFALYRGAYYGARQDGLCLLEGPDQDGVEIHPGVRLGPINFTTDRNKRLRSMRLGASGEDVQARVGTDRGDEGFFDLEGDRIVVSRDIQGKEFIVDIQDFAELSFVEITPLILIGK